MKNLLILLPILLGNQLTVLSSTQTNAKPLPPVLSSDSTDDQDYLATKYDFCVSKFNTFTTLLGQDCIFSRAIIISIALALGALLFAFNKFATAKTALVLRKIAVLLYNHISVFVIFILLIVIAYLIYRERTLESKIKTLEESVKEAKAKAEVKKYPNHLFELAKKAKARAKVEEAEKEAKAQRAKEKKAKEELETAIQKQKKAEKETAAAEGEVDKKAAAAAERKADIEVEEAEAEKVKAIISRRQAEAKVVEAKEEEVLLNQASLKKQANVELESLPSSSKGPVIYRIIRSKFNKTQLN